MEDAVEYWIWLSQALSAGSPKADRLLAAFGDAAGVYCARRADYLALGILTDREIVRLCDKSLGRAEKIVGDCMRLGYHILTPPRFPRRLCDIYARPLVLYVFGELPEPESGIYIGMVGTRRITPYGMEAATKIAAGLAHFGAVVVSGMALGVDAAAHSGAIRGGGKTVAVIGCGIDVDYPSRHRELKRTIAQNGAVVSEYPPGTRPDRINFPVRNRLIAGLSLGCVVVEAGSRSGALITASLAAEMGRDVFAVPGSIFSEQSAGTNRLLRDGVKPVCTVMDIMEEYIGLCPQSIISRMSDESGGSQLSFGDPAAPAAETASLKENDQDTKRQIKTAPPGAPRENPESFADTSLSNTQLPLSPAPNSVPLQEFALADAAAPHSAPLQESTPARHGANCPGAAGATPADAAAPNSAPLQESTPARHGATCPGAAGGGLSEKQRMVYNVLTDTPQHVDAVALRANLELRTVLAALTTLEIEGFAHSLPGRRYVSGPA